MRERLRRIQPRRGGLFQNFEMFVWGESESPVIWLFVSRRFVIIDQSVGKCDQGNKPKHVILPSYNKLRKC